MPDEREFDGELVDRFLRYVRGRGPRPELEHLSEEERAKHEGLFQLLGAMVDGEPVELPPIDKDPVAIRLGLVDGHDADASVSDNDKTEVGAHELQSHLAELKTRFGGDVEVFVDEEIPQPGHSANGLLPAFAVCQTLGETILVCVTPEADISAILEDARLVFAERPATAVALVSRDSGEGAVVREAHCVRAIDPIRGWVEPALPRDPEPIELALGRYIDQSLARWDEVARLEDAAVFSTEGNGVHSIVQSVMSKSLGRTLQIPARKKALEDLQSLSAGSLESLVSEVRSENLPGDQLIDRVRSLSDVSKR